MGPNLGCLTFWIEKWAPLPQMHACCSRDHTQWQCTMCLDQLRVVSCNKQQICSLASSFFKADFFYVEDIVFRRFRCMKHVQKGNKAVQLFCPFTETAAACLSTSDGLHFQQNSIGMFSFFGPLYHTALWTNSIGSFIGSLVSLGLVTSSDKGEHRGCVTIIIKLWHSSLISSFVNGWQQQSYQ